VFKTWKFWVHRYMFERRQERLALLMSELTRLQSDVEGKQTEATNLKTSLEVARAQQSRRRELLNRVNANISLGAEGSCVLV